KMIADVARMDGNEAETRRRVERIFTSLMGYDSLKHISREHAVRGPGVTEYCDFTIQLDEGDKAKSVIFVELKRVNVDLATKHLKQVSSYAINAGCEWIMLTNGREWRTYHVSFGQPPETKLISSWNLLQDEPATLAKKFSLFGYRNVRRGGLDEIWQKANVLTPRNLLSVILSEESIRLLRRKLKKATDVRVAPEEIVGAIRRILNEAALGEMEKIKISLPEKKQRPRKPKPASPAQETPPEVQSPESM
ncbi:MAG: type I restriction enzyme HsdR N-terminal domain-containing protein, partial [Phycisphaerae bacterium]|nr:type I restriction enzyme HsdR N-terminal domain-containing protein [Phycisphaerae bacterium]